MFIIVVYPDLRGIPVHTAQRMRKYLKRLSYDPAQYRPLFPAARRNTLIVGSVDSRTLIVPCPASDSTLAPGGPSPGDSGLKARQKASGVQTGRGKVLSRTSLSCPDSPHSRQGPVNRANSCGRVLCIFLSPSFR